MDLNNLITRKTFAPNILCQIFTECTADDNREIASKLINRLECLHSENWESKPLISIDFI